MTELNQVKQIISLLDKTQLDALLWDCETDMRTNVETLIVCVLFKNHEQIEKIKSILKEKTNIRRFDTEGYNTYDNHPDLDDKNFNNEKTKSFEFDITNNPEIANYLKPFDKYPLQNQMYKNVKSFFKSENN